MTPEQRAEAVLQLIESDFGQSGRDVRFLAIRDELVAAINETKEDCMRICANEMVSGETGTEGDEGYNQAIIHCVESILASKIKDVV